ncbi:hypothetical protein O6H91_09G087100 [Diphasiastrum complanatum]|uniref:Uncharacterized protein n=1 Tax=Diphasiastrum complanatum TaxID=34168 RepID=A0ACC2CRI0_DIPCM|nr:hypothetical protein O6H91_09G087100 [Diphasiastrum complanatum]
MAATADKLQEQEPKKAYNQDEDIECVLWTAADIEKRVAELGAEISRDYSGIPIVLIGVATGAVMFLADLMRKLSIPVLVDFVRVQSYGNQTQSSGVATISTDVKISIKDKHVLVVEDIIDTGITLSKLVKHLATKEPASVSVCALLDKISRRVIPLQLSEGSRFYRGFECSDNFVVGYGMDFAELYRNLAYIGVLKPDIYS